MKSKIKPHKKYTDILKTIGSKLGYEINCDSPSEQEGYHLANPDCIWYQSINAIIRGCRGIPDKVPLIGFEVLYSKKEKNMRGSLASFMLRDAYRGVFVVLKRVGENDADFQDRIGYLENIIGRFNSCSLCKWEAKDVDKLEYKLGISV